jgi:hypothetical protein
VPMSDGDYAYGSSYRTGGEHPRYFRVPRAGGEQQIILDGDGRRRGRPSPPRRRGSFAGSWPPALGFRRQGFRILHTSGCVTSLPAASWPTWSPGPRGPASGMPTAAGSTTRDWTTTIAPRASTTIASQRPGAGQARLRGNRPRLLHECRWHARPSLGAHRHQRSRDFRVSQSSMRRTRRPRSDWSSRVRRASSTISRRAATASSC